MFELRVFVFQQTWSCIFLSCVFSGLTFLSGFLVSVLAMVQGDHKLLFSFYDSIQ